MALSLQNDLCKEIETLQIDDVTPTLAHRRRMSWSRFSRPRLNTTATGQVYLPQRSRKGRIGKHRSSSLYSPRTGTKVTSDDVDDGGSKEDKAVMTGWLYKTSRPKTSKARGHRQHRKFKLTAHSLEYSNLIQKVLLGYSYTEFKCA